MIKKTICDIIRIMNKWLISTLLTLFVTTSVLAHSWYPHECCSDNDCKPVGCEEIVETQTGYKYIDPKTGQVVEFTKDQERPSQDGKCHVCYLPSKSYCLFTLQGS